MRSHTRLSGHRKRVRTKSWLWDQYPSPHRGTEPASAACRFVALLTELHPRSSLILAVGKNQESIPARHGSVTTRLRQSACARARAQKENERWNNYRFDYFQLRFSLWSILFFSSEHCKRQQILLINIPVLPFFVVGSSCAQWNCWIAT